jgi:hypothetical protein
MLVNTGEGPSGAGHNPHKNKSLVVVPMRENGKLRPGIEVMLGILAKLMGIAKRPPAQG